MSISTPSASALLTPAETAERLGITPHDVLRLIGRGSLPGHLIGRELVPSAYRIPVEGLADFIVDARDAVGPAIGDNGEFDDRIGLGFRAGRLADAISAAAVRLELMPTIDDVRRRILAGELPTDATLELPGDARLLDIARGPAPALALIRERDLPWTSWGELWAVRHARLEAAALIRDRNRAKDVGVERLPPAERLYITPAHYKGVCDAVRQRIEAEPVATIRVPVNTAPEGLPPDLRSVPVRFPARHLDIDYARVFSLAF